MAFAPVCFSGSCDQSGQCLFETFPNGTPCDNDDACTPLGDCVDGECLGRAADGAVDLEFRVAAGAKTVSVGDIVEVDLWAVLNGSQPAPSSAFCAPGEHPIAGMEVAFSWDPAYFALADPSLIGAANPQDPCVDFDSCNVDCGESGRYNWSTSVFPNDCNADGLNAPCPGFPENDGNGLYLAFKQFSCGGQPAAPACVPSSGLWVTTLKFKAVGATAGVASPTQILLEDCIGQTRTKVADEVFTGLDTLGALAQPPPIAVACAANEGCPARHACQAGSCVPCPTSLPVEPEKVVNAAGLLVDSTSNRFLSFTVGTPGLREGIQVTFVDLPPPFDEWNELTLWVATPSEVCGLSGVVDALDPDCTSTITVASLTCDAQRAFFGDWGALGTVNVHHAWIIPGGAYEVRTVEESVADAESCFSDPVEIRTAGWGDIAGDLDNVNGGWTGPDQIVDIPHDVLAAIDQFGNRPGSPGKVRVDVEPCRVDFKIQISDITRILDAFRGLPLPFVPGGVNPPCPAGPCGSDVIE